MSDRTAGRVVGAVLLLAMPLSAWLLFALPSTWWGSFISMAPIYGAVVFTAAMRRGRGNLGNAERCQRCRGQNVVWFAPSPLWNLVMRGNDFEGDARYHDLVCMGCFVVLAEEAGVKGHWRLSVDPEPEGLIKVTPSGRVWDEAKNLWVDPT